jgi:hypothetical protein
MSTPNYREEFEKFLMTEHPAAAGDKLPEVQQHVKDMYFSEYEGCVPDHMLGEDTMQDVKDKFYYPLSFIRSLFVAKHPELKGKICIVIDASYESDTHYIMYADSKILFDYAVEAWKFVFDHDIDFNEEVEYVLGKMEEAYKIKTIEITIEGGVIQEVAIPKGTGVEVKVMDFDTEDADLADLDKPMPHSTLKENKDGEYYYESHWTEADSP